MGRKQAILLRSLQRRSPRYARRLDQLLRQSLTRIGHRNELRALQILSDHLRDHPNEPPWFYRVELAIGRGDGRGIDIVVTSDVGPLFLQIKSSDIFKKVQELAELERQRYERRITIVETVIVNDRRSDGEILRDCLLSLRRLRSTVARHGRSFIKRKYKPE